MKKPSDGAKFIGTDVSHPLNMTIATFAQHTCGITLG